MLEELGLPREISVAPGTQTTDREPPVDAEAPHVVGDATGERLEASDVLAPPLERLPPHWPIFVDGKGAPVGERSPCSGDQGC